MNKMISCGRCGGPMTGKRSTYGLSYYRCNNQKNKYFCDQVENRILDFITEKLLLDGYLENYYKELLVNQKKRRTALNTILKLQSQKKKLVDRI